jgi:hypothetical protein
METLQTLLAEACDQSGEVNFRPDYSGRGMYGRECVGITGPYFDCMQVISAVIVEAARNMADADMPDFGEFEQKVETLMNFSQDSMGRGAIIYWPSLESVKVEEYEDEE